MVCYLPHLPHVNYSKLRTSKTYSCIPGSTRKGAYIVNFNTLFFQFYFENRVTVAIIIDMPILKYNCIYLSSADEFVPCGKIFTLYPCVYDTIVIYNGRFVNIGFNLDFSCFRENQKNRFIFIIIMKYLLWFINLIWRSDGTSNKDKLFSVTTTTLCIPSWFWVLTRVVSGSRKKSINSKLKIIIYKRWFPDIFYSRYSKIIIVITLIYHRVPTKITIN